MKNQKHRTMLIALSLAAASAVPALTASTAFARSKPTYAAKVSMDQARKTALGRMPGKVIAEELEHEKGTWIYSFEIAANGGKAGEVQEVNVDADSGSVVDVQTEQAGDSHDKDGKTGEHEGGDQGGGDGEEAD